MKAQNASLVWKSAPITSPLQVGLILSGGGGGLSSFLTWADIDWVCDTWQSDRSVGGLFILLFIKTFANLRGGKKKKVNVSSGC